MKKSIVKPAGPASKGLRKAGVASREPVLIRYLLGSLLAFVALNAFAGGYDIRGQESVRQTFKNFDKIIGLKWLKMSHANDSKIELAGRKDRHEHIGEGKIGKKGFGALIKFLIANQFPKNAPFPLILETEHDKVKEDIKILKALRDKK